MDRFCYKGPKWEGIGVPKSILEEENPVYRRAEPEKLPDDDDEEGKGKEGDHGFEYVVR